jgi:hypothetical protein
LVAEVQAALAHAMGDRSAADPAREQLAGCDVAGLTARQHRDHPVREVKNVVVVALWPPNMTFPLAWIKNGLFVVSVGTSTTSLTLIDARHRAKRHPRSAEAPQMARFCCRPS